MTIKMQTGKKSWKRWRPQEVAAVSYINIPERYEEEIVKAHISDLKHMSTDELKKMI